jgi:hypothetical protein
MVGDELTYKTTEKKLQDEFNFYKKTPGRMSGVSYKNEIVKYFQQDNFFRQEKNLWRNPEIRKRLTENRVKYLFKNDESELTDNEILTGFKKSGMCYGYSHFNPLWFKWFIERYNVKRCYDPCGGWGHRLLGAIDLDLYIYNDLSRSTAEACQDIANYFDMENVMWFNEDAIECEPENLTWFDSIFTCPPYYNVEVYECGPFESLEHWEMILDSLHRQFETYDFIKTMGIVLREDLLPQRYQNYTEKFGVKVHKMEHMLKNTKKSYEEYLYVWVKE